MAAIQWGSRATIQWGSTSVDDAIARKVDAAADMAGVPRNVLRAFVLAESGGRPDAVGNEEAGGVSVGLLQLYDRGQGAGMTIAERKDPDRNLAVGVPPIARAWAANSHLSGRNRVTRTAAESGHPGDPAALTPGSRPWQIATNGTGRIADLWQRLESADPTIPAAGGATPLGFSAEGIQRAVDEAVTLVRENPGKAAVAVGAALLFL